MSFETLISTRKIWTSQNGMKKENYMITFHVHFHVLLKFVFIVIID
jgi:hypothetical protein